VSALRGESVMIGYLILEVVVRARSTCPGLTVEQVLILVKIEYVVGVTAGRAQCK
jgi:hypothetical protein